MATVSKELCDEIIASNGYYLNDPRVMQVVKYQNAFGGESWAILSTPQQTMSLIRRSCGKQSADKYHDNPTSTLLLLSQVRYQTMRSLGTLYTKGYVMNSEHIITAVKKDLSELAKLIQFSLANAHVYVNDHPVEIETLYNEGSKIHEISDHVVQIIKVTR
jgi:hypothetical protein